MRCCMGLLMSVMIVGAGCKKSSEPVPANESTPAPAAPAPARAPAAVTEGADAVLDEIEPELESVATPPIDEPDSAERWQGAGVSWAVPAEWTQEPGGNAMRFATLVPPQGIGPQITVTHFPGNVGGVLANINRWRTQLGLPPIAEEDIPTATTALPVGNADGLLIDLHNTEAGTRMLAVMVEVSGRTWFFKMSGDQEAIERQQAAFRALVESVRF